MNDQLQSALVELIGKANSGIDYSVNFLSAELPDVVTQVLMWNLVYSAIWFAVCFACSVVSVVAVIKYNSRGAIAKLNEAYERGDSWTRYSKTSDAASKEFYMAKEQATPKKWVLVALAVASCAITLTKLTWLKILIAPKLYLIEYAATLVK